MGRNQHVVPRGGQWAVVGEGNSRAGSLHPTQDEAIRVGKERAKRERAELIVHRRDGRIRERNSYGHDPLPPRG